MGNFNINTVLCRGLAQIKTVSLLSWQHNIFPAQEFFRSSVVTKIVPVGAGKERFERFDAVNRAQRNADTSVSPVHHILNV